MYPEVINADDLDVTARTVYGEARGEAFEGKVAVAHVISNRAASNYMGDTLEAVCRRAYQFSCWNHSDPNHRKIAALDKSDPEYRECLSAVAAALVSDDDPTHGARHYHTKDIKPYWSDDAKERVVIGNHVFLVGVA